MEGVVTPAKLEMGFPSCDQSGEQSMEPPGEEGVNCNGPCTPLVALQDVGNTLKPTTPLLLPKKSLLKRPKSETSLLDSPPNPPPKKRIRIVENLEATNSNNYIELEEPKDPRDMKGSLTNGGNVVAPLLQEVISCGETIRWLQSPSSAIDQTQINVGYVRDNLSEVKRHFSVEIDMKFILSDSCSAVLASKTSIVDVGCHNFHTWVDSHSPHNSLRLKNIVYKSNFLKIANLDALLGFNLSRPRQVISEDVPNQKRIHFVGELWQNSKGFREYLSWKSSQAESHLSTKLLTMRTSAPYSTRAQVSHKIDLTIPDASPPSDDQDLCHPETTESFGNCTQVHNILDIAVVDNFVAFVHSRTNGQGLHTLVVDNEELSNVYESCREIRIQKYIYSQAIICLRALRPGGTFILKLFDMFTLLTNSLLFLLYKCFRRIAIHKPASSSACTSERFLICEEKLDNEDTKYVEDFLTDAFDMVTSKQEHRKIVRRRVRKRLAITKLEVQKIVPLSVILGDADFFQYVRETNIRLTTCLGEAIQEVCSSIQSKSSAKDGDKCRQSEDDFLTKLNVPFDEYHRSSQTEEGPLLVTKFLADNGIKSELLLKPVELEMEEKEGSLHGFVVYPTLNSDGKLFKNLRGWFFGCGGNKLMLLKDGSWMDANLGDTIALPFGTLVYGELVQEIHSRMGEKVKKYVSCIHILDGAFVRGTYLGSFSVETRHEILTRFLHSLKTDAPGALATPQAFLIPPLPQDKLLDFYESCKSQQDFLGYPPLVKCYPSGGDTDTERTLVADSFLLRKTVAVSNPLEFFERLEHFVWTWPGGYRMANLLNSLRSRLE